MTEVSIVDPQFAATLENFTIKSLELHGVKRIAFKEAELDLQAGCERSAFLPMLLLIMAEEYADICPNLSKITHIIEPSPDALFEMKLKSAVDFKLIGIPQTSFLSYLNSCTDTLVTECRAKASHDPETLDIGPALAKRLNTESISTPAGRRQQNQSTG